MNLFDRLNDPNSQPFKSFFIGAAH